MGYSQTVLGQRFFDGKTGRASNLKVVEDEYGGLMVVGFGHAVYAYRFPDGTTLGFLGWYNEDNERKHAGSQATKAQYGALRLRSTVDFTVEGWMKKAAPKKYTFNPERWSKYLWRHEREDVALPVDV